MKGDLLEPGRATRNPVREPVSRNTAGIPEERKFPWRGHPFGGEASRARAGELTQRIRHTRSKKRIQFVPAVSVPLVIGLS